MNSTRTAYFTTLNSCPQLVVLMESLRSSNEVWERSVEGISGQVIGTPARIQAPLNVEGVVWRRRRLRRGVISEQIGRATGKYILASVFFSKKQPGRC
jgi:hypothetical protein